MFAITCQDIQLALRRLRKDPLFTLAAVLPMALGIGVNTAMFTVGDALLRKPLVIPEIERIAAIVESPPERESAISFVTPGDYLDVQRQNRSFEHIGAYQYQDRVLTGGDSPVPVVAVAVSPEFFKVFALPLAMGRALTGVDNDEAASIMVSYGFWRDRLGADPGIVGRTIELDSQRYTVVGVTSKRFNFPIGAEAWLRLAIDAKAANDRTSHDIQLAGKLRPGIPLVQANTEVKAIADRLATAYPGTNRDWGMHAIPLSELITGRMTGQYVTFLLGGVLFVLVMACSNVANLQLARGATRINEMAVREALGASRTRMISLLLTESMLIALIGGLLSLPLASTALNMIRGNMPAETVKYIPGFDSIEMDRSALLLALAMAILSGVLAGITPALRITTGSIGEVLKAGGRLRTASRGNTRLRSVLLVGEVTLAMVLLVGTGLMVRGVHSLSNVNSGSEPAKLLTMWISLPESRYSNAASCERFHARLLNALSSLPHVDSVAIGSNIPYGGQGIPLPLTIEGSAPARPGERPSAMAEAISPAYFASLRIRLRAGRSFDSRDRQEAPAVAIVSQALAKRYWPNQDPLGRRLRIDSPAGGHWITVVGVAATVSFSWLDDPSTPVLYLPLSQFPSRDNFVLLRSGQPRQLIGAVRERVHSIDAMQPVLGAKTWDAVIAQSMIGLSYVAVIMTVLGVIAVVLAFLGLFGLMLYNIHSQRNEIGIRLALGATASMILRMVLGRALLLTGSGIAIGAGAAILMSHLLSKLIFGVSSADPMVYTFPALALFLSGLTSAYFPARMASRTDTVRI
jgi:putative ABC transport system permease protein